MGRRGRPSRPDVWTLVTRNKRLVTLDLSQADGIEILHRLTAVADVVLLNHPRALLERLGCTYEAIAARNSRAVVVNTSTFGPTGPYADRPGNGSLAEAFSGLTRLLAGPDGEPGPTPVLFGDYLTALAGTVGTVAACYWRDVRSGTGQNVDLTQFEAVLGLLGPQLIGWAPDDRAPERPRPGGLRGTFRTADGAWLTVTAYSDAQVSRLLAAVGVSADATEGGAGTGTDLAALATRWIGAHDRETVTGALLQARIQTAPVNDIGSLLSDPQVRHRGSVVDLDDADLGTLRLARPAPVLGATPGGVRWINRPLGADTGAVYAEWLGIGPEELDGLRARGVV